MTQDFNNLPFSDDLDPAPEPPLPRVPAPPRTSRIGQRIAEASWISCGLAIILSLLTGALHLQSRTAVLSFTCATIGLMVLGLVLSLIAFVGMRWWASPDISRPALTGLILSLALLGLTARAMHLSRLNAERQLEAVDRERQEQLRRFQQVQQDAFLESGWLGVQPVKTVLVTLISSGSSLYSGILHDLGTDSSLVLMGARNIAQEAAKIDVSGAVATLDDGSQVAALDIAGLINNARQHREELRRAYLPPLTLPASQGGATLIFFPPTIDWQRVRNIALKVDGDPQVIPGRFYTADEKRRMIRAATQPATAVP